jgi:CelD/BcsL family acetyltransferase involved in cellulose biosynthesis
MSSLVIPLAPHWTEPAAGSQGNSKKPHPAHQNETDSSACVLSFVRDRAAFDALETEWNDLFERSAPSHQLFQSFKWLWHWCNHYLDADTELSILTGRVNGRLVMVWPLVKVRMAGLTELAWMGDPISQYGDALMDDVSGAEDILRQAWKHLAAYSGADVVKLRKVRKDARLTFLLEELRGDITERLVAPYLDLGSAPNFAEYEKRYSSGSRRNRKRLFRRLDEQGKITFEEIEGGSRVRDLITTAITLKRGWLKSRGLLSKAFADDRISRFFSDAAEGSVRPCGCRLAVLSSAGRPAAIEVALRCKERTALHIIVYDLEFEKSGAGVLLLERSLRNAGDSGVKCYDLLAPGDSYKLDWADASVDVLDWALPLTIKGKIFSKVYLGFLRERLKAGHAALPAGIRRLLSGRFSRAVTAM